jgi:ribonucleotide reductase alpha subunit
MSFSGAISVINRKGETIPMRLETISKRLAELVNMEPRLSIRSDYVASKTAASLINGIKTTEIDTISASICASLIIDDYEYDTLAARIVINSLHKVTHNDLRKYAKDLQSYVYRDIDIAILHPKTIAFINKHYQELHKLIDYSKDYTYNYFGAVTLINSYLLSYKFDNDQKCVKERPQQMLLRVAIGIHLDQIDIDGACSKDTLKAISETHQMLSDKYYTHATPTLFNAGTIHHTLSSCYLLSVNDSLDNIYQRLTDISKISKFSGGVGIHVSQVRAQGSVIASTVGRSEGLIPMLRMYNESTKFVSQGGGKRKGSTAVYIEPWHADIESCILSQKQQGVPEKLCRDLFLAIWMPDLFMLRLKQSIKSGQPVMWSLMCPNECKGLADVYGDEFNHLYESYEREGKYRKQIPIVQLWNMIVSTQIETGKPYLMFKDHVNRKCNQNNLGTIKSSNLCVHGDTRILTYQGYQTIKHLNDQLVSVWNGIRWSSARVSKTGSDQQLVKVTTNDGAELLCTLYHRFKLVDGKQVEAQNLKIGNALMQCQSWPMIDGNQTGYTDDEVPINASIQVKRKWLAKYINENQFVTREYPKQLRLTCKTMALAYDIKLLCNTLGFSPSISFLDDGLSPSEDSPPSTIQIIMTGKDTYYLFDILHLPINRPRSMHIEPNYSYTRLLEVVSVELVSGTHDTYCFAEPDQHMGVFNGILTAQCSEITIYSDDNQVGVCNLASICLPKFVTKHADGSATFDYQKLNQVAQKVVFNMDKVINNNKYPIDQAKYSDSLHRPIGVGVQGLADVFMMMGEAFDSKASRQMNSDIFETIYFAALTASNQLAKRDGAYASFGSSMTANGLFQHDLTDNPSVSKDLNWDWAGLRHEVQYGAGLRHSLLTCLMPTAGTSIIMENSESIEVPTSFLYTRSTLSGRFQVVNKYLMKDLKKLGLWSKSIRDKLIQYDGSVQSIAEIPQHIKDVYKTVFEYKMSNVIHMCADRERFICQSASNNRYVADPSIGKLTKAHLLSFKLGLKTSSYYTRIAQVSKGKKFVTTEVEDEVCTSCTA